MRIFDRTSATEKKRELGLDGTLVGRHLSSEVRVEFLKVIEAAVTAGESMAAVCRWKRGVTSKKAQGGGGGRNRITPSEEKRIVRLAQKFPQLWCRRIAYEIERKGLAFVKKRGSRRL